MDFKRGDEVEVLNKEEGFEGSYFSANIISHISKKDYIVQYTTLLETDGSRPLREILSTDKIRPKPPKILSTDFCLSQDVDAYHNDGWWVGKVVNKNGSTYLVHFETSGEEIEYKFSDLRVHQDWVDGVWVYSKLL